MLVPSRGQCPVSRETVRPHHGNLAVRKGTVPESNGRTVADEEIRPVDIAYEFMDGSAVNEVHVNDAVSGQLPLHAGVDLGRIRRTEVVIDDQARASDLQSRNIHGGR